MERTEPSPRLIFYSTLLWGLVAHGMMLVNKFSFHDDARLAFKIGATVSSGRWMLGVFKHLSQAMFGGTLYSLPLFNGLLSLFFIAFASFVIVKILDIKSSENCIILSGLMVSFPVVTAMMGYMYTMPYYVLGLDMALVGVFFICRRNGKFWSLPLGSVLVACGIGVYQAGLPFALSMMLMHMMRNFRDDEMAEKFDFLRECCLMVLACVLFMGIYFSAVAVSLKLFDLELTDYQSINTMGFSAWLEYLDRIKRAYVEFFLPPSGKMRDMFPLASIRALYWTVLAAGTALAFRHALRLFKASASNGAKFLLLVLLFPLATNFVYVMVDVKMLHSLMVYPKVLVFVAFLCFLEEDACALHDSRLQLRCLGRVVLICVAVLYCYFSNICYYKALFLQNQAIAYFTRLVARIEGTKGYSPYLPVVFVNPLDKMDFNEPVIPEFERFKLLPYINDRETSFINDYAWEDFMRMWCGFSPIVIKETESYEQLPEVQEMPRYPVDGSIRVIGRALVVKF